MKNEARKRGEFARSGTQAAVIHTWEGKKKLMPEKASTGKCWVLPHTKEQAGLGRLQTPEWSFAISTSTAAVGVLYNPKVQWMKPCLTIDGRGGIRRKLQKSRFTS